MMLGERIWGKQFIKELSEPHSDPGIRQMEKELNESWWRYYRELYRKPSFEEAFDVLPACYKKVKL